MPENPPPTTPPGDSHSDGRESPARRVRQNRQELRRRAELIPPVIAVTDRLRATLIQVLTDACAALESEAAYIRTHPDESDGTLGHLMLEDLIANAYDYPLDTDPPADAESRTSPERQWVLIAARRMIALHAHRAPGWTFTTDLATTEWWLDGQPLDIRAAVASAARDAARSGFTTNSSLSAPPDSRPPFP